MENAIFKSAVGLPAPVVPKGSYPVTDSSFIAGGLHTVDNETALTKIPLWVRKLGMEVYVISSNRKYRLINEPNTNTTNLVTDWKEVKDGTGEAGDYLTRDEWSRTYDELMRELGETYVSMNTLTQNYITARALAYVYQTKADMIDYVTVDMLNNLTAALSKIIVRIIPPAVIRLSKGTDISSVALPTEVVVTFADGMSTSVPVTWDRSTYDPDLVGFQLLAGQMFLPSFVMGGEGVDDFDKCNLFVQVIGEGGDVVPTPLCSDVSGFADIEPLIVTKGTTLGELPLPSTVSTEVVSTDGSVSYKDLNVTWDTESIGESTYAINSPLKITGTVETGESLLVTNILGYKPEIVVHLSDLGADTFDYKISIILEAGKSEIDLSSTALSGLKCEDLYGLADDIAQATVDIRFLGVLDKEGNNTTSELLDDYPDGIRMPVFTSTSSDVAAFQSAINDLSTKVGVDLKYDVPGADFGGKIYYDDNLKTIIFPNGVPNDTLYLVRKCSSGTII